MFTEIRDLYHQHAISTSTKLQKSYLSLCQLTFASWYVATWSRSPRPASLASILKRLNMAALHRRLARQVPLRNGELRAEQGNRDRTQEQTHYREMF